MITCTQAQLPVIGDLKLTPIAELAPFAKNLSCRFIILEEVDQPKEAREGGIIYTFRVADESAAVVVNFWNEQGGDVQPGDVILMTGAFVTFYRQHLRLSTKLGSVVRIGKFAFNYDDSVDMSCAVYRRRMDPSVVEFESFADE